MGSVGDWSYGQGIRKASGDHFFYELREKYFFPLGLNHPVGLRTKWFHSDPLICTQYFPTHLCESFPILKDWSWCIRPKTNNKISSKWFKENSTLKNSFGWDGFNHLQAIEGWSVELNDDYEWVASNSLIEPGQSTPAAFSFQEQIKVFLSEDVLGNQGRLKDWMEKLSVFSWGEWKGLNFCFKTHCSLSELNNAGIAVDIINGEIHAHFCLSMLPEDVENIMRALRPYQG